MISTHILDTTAGMPAANVTVRLELQKGATWDLLASEATNSDGRISFTAGNTAGTYRLTFVTDAYFAARKQECFFQGAQVVFKISDTGRKYHVPLLLNPYSYSTYRGS